MCILGILLGGKVWIIEGITIFNLHMKICGPDKDNRSFLVSSYFNLIKLFDSLLSTCAKPSKLLKYTNCQGNVIL